MNQLFTTTTAGVRNGVDRISKIRIRVFGALKETQETAIEQAKLKRMRKAETRSRNARYRAHKSELI